MSEPTPALHERIHAFLDFDKRIFFVILSLLYILVRYITNDLILEAVPGNEKIEAEGGFLIFHIFNSLGYIWTPFSILWRVTMTAMLIWMGSFAFGYKAPFVAIWKFALVADIIFLLPELIKMLFFIIAVDNVGYQEIRDFFPLSVYSLIDPSSVAEKYHYPLKTINLFELLYLAAMILGYHTVSKKDLDISSRVVATSYGLGLVLWLVFYILVY
jgi:hypothetical protein